MQVEQEQQPSTTRSRRVLNVGSGDHASVDPTRPVFRNTHWEVVRLDINPAVEPDLLGSITDLDQLCAPESFDAVFSSHSIEHLYAHEVLPSIRSFHRVLKPDGFAVITCPDLETLLAFTLQNGLEVPVYDSPAGPITGLDMLFGHTQSIARGNTFMAHKTGFTGPRLGNLLLQAGFASAAVDRVGWDLWGVGMRDQADTDEIRRELCAGGLLMTL